jgi:glycosyltransferase involved in cell wall biosynthesis
LKKKGNNIFILAEFNEFGGTRIYFENLKDFFKDKNVDAYYLLNQSQINLIGTEADKINILKIPTITRFWRKWPISLVFDLFIVLKYFFRYKPSKIILSVHNPGQYLAFLVHPAKKYYILHSKISSEGKFIFKVKHFIKFFQKKVIFLGVSDITCENLKNFWKASNVQLLPNFSRFNREYLYNEQNNIILSVGHFTKTKNTEFWLQVAIYTIENTLKDYKFVWVGTGDDLETKNKIPSKYVNQIIHMENTDEIDLMYKSSFLYFHPSLFENMSLVMLEAMSFSLPLIASDIQGNKLLLRNEVNGFMLNEGSVKCFFESLLNIENNYEFFAQNSYKMYVKEFSKSVWEQNFISILEL